MKSLLVGWVWFNVKTTKFHAVTFEIIQRYLTEIMVVVLAQHSGDKRVGDGNDMYKREKGL